MNKILLLMLTCFYSVNTYAYLGPGMAGGVLASIIGIIAAILIGFGAILYYPIKRALKKKQDSQEKEETDEEDEAS